MMPNLEVLHVDNKRIPVWVASPVQPVARDSYRVPPLQHLTELSLGDSRLSAIELTALLAAVGPKLTKFSIRRTWLLLEGGCMDRKCIDKAVWDPDVQCPLSHLSVFIIQFNHVLRALSRWRTTLTHLSFTTNETPPQHSSACQRLSNSLPVDLSELATFTALQHLHTEVSFFAGHATLYPNENPFTNTVPESIRHLVLRGTHQDLVVAACAFTAAMAQGRYTALEEIVMYDYMRYDTRSVSKVGTSNVARFGSPAVMWEVWEEAKRIEGWPRLADWLLLFGVQLNMKRGGG